MKQIEIPKIDKSWKAFFQAFHQKQASVQKIDYEPFWNPKYIFLQEPKEVLKLEDVGYSPEEINECKGERDEILYIGKFRFLNDEGIDNLLYVTSQLEERIVPSSYIVGQWLRGVGRHSQFIYDMVRDSRLLIAFSEMIGVPLIPHPIRDAAIVLNKLTASKGGNLHKKESLAAWHLDGMNYVFIILLSDPKDFEGGNLVYYRKHKDLLPEVLLPTDPAIYEIPFERPGDVVFMRGSCVQHAVTSLTRGERKSLILSFFCPYLSEDDSNTFWHLAPADGFVRTIQNWVRFKWPVRSAKDYYRRVNVPFNSPIKT